MGLGPFDLAGGPFLALYGILFVVAVTTSILIGRWLRPDGRPTRITDSGAAAYLAGGPARFTETAVADLLVSGALAVEEKKRLRVLSTGAGGSAVQRRILALSSPASWKDVLRATAGEAGSAEQSLVRDELLMDRSTALQLGFFQAMPMILLAMFGATKWYIGSMREKPVGFLTILLIITAIVFAVRFFAADRRTWGGRQILREMRARADRLSRAPPRDETAMAVALFGTAVLAGSMYADFHELRRAGDGGGDSGGGSDGGGCGGGGCGGCGG